MKRLADLTDAELLAAGGPGAILEKGGPESGTPALPSSKLLSRRELKRAEHYRRTWPWLSGGGAS
jgi:hypothetical protein